MLGMEEVKGEGWGITWEREAAEGVELGGFS